MNNKNIGKFYFKKISRQKKKTHEGSNFPRPQSRQKQHLSQEKPKTHYSQESDNINR